MDEVVTGVLQPEFKKTNWNLIVVISLIGILIIVIIFIAITLYFYKSSSLSTQDFVNGKSLTLKTGQVINFNIEENQKHSLIVDSIGSDSVNITIESGKIVLTLKIGEERKVDLNSDGKEELQIKLERIENSKVILLIKRLELFAQQSVNQTQQLSNTPSNLNGLSSNESTTNECSENWYCTNWTECGSQNIQGRVCTDSNNCDTNKNKPQEFQACNLSSATGKCSDSDSGKDYFTKGNVIDSYNAVYEDKCNPSSSTENNLLEEWFCTSDGLPSNENHLCEFKCENGKCLAPTTTCASGDNYCPTGCSRSQDNDCECNADIDCIDLNNKNKAGLCIKNTLSSFPNECFTKTVSALIEFNGNLQTFCTSYMNQCQSSEIVVKKDNKEVTAKITGPGSGSAGTDVCNIMVTFSNGAGGGGTMVKRLGDSTDSCMHNAYVYFYESVTGDCGSSPCLPGQY